MRGDGSAGRSSAPDIWASPGWRDVQSLAGHASLADKQRYIDQSDGAKRRVLAMYVEP
jgi:hypothetical protein